MVSKAQKFRLGVFITVNLFLLLGFIFLVAGSKLTQKRDVYYVRFHDVSINGLQVGSAVKYHGITIGRVDDISIDKKNVRDIIATLSIKKGTPLKEDVKATLTPVGITGLMQIELRGGTNEKPLLKPNAFIQTGKSVFQNITGKAEVISEKLELLINNLNQLTGKQNQQKISNIITNLNNTIEDNKNRVNEMVTYSDSLILTANTLLLQLNATTQRLNGILNSPEMTKILKNSAKISDDLAGIDFEQLSKDVKNTLNQTNRTLKHIDGLVITNRQDIKSLIVSLRETIDYLNDFSRQLSENPSIILKSRKK